LLHYLSQVLRRNVDHIRRLRVEAMHDCLVLDAVTQEHLELTTARAGRAASLLGTIDRTVTPMGARTLRHWLLHPLLERPAITARQDAIEQFLHNAFLLAELRDELGEIRDLERAIARLSLGSGNARDLAALGSSLARLPSVRACLEKFSAPLLATLHGRLAPLPELVARLEAALVDSPPALLRDGGMIRPGFDPRLDELHRAAHEGKEWIAALQEREIERTGIKSLKVRYTSVFGYFIEITKANLAAVPEDYVRKQTTVNGERFITPELKEMEGKILGADEKSKALEVEIFQALRAEAVAELTTIQETAMALGELDGLVGLAETARVLAYTRPVIEEEPVLEIVEGRHPVLDAKAGQERFVPNDTHLHAGTARLAIITGPNMAGKSTYIRQVALLVILAQVGSYLPAASARIGWVDRIFTRVGASDDLARGQSTFMVEMSETANILHHATGRSLVILDEIGRGTSTFDGLSIAWSVAEFLHDQIGARTLFATHYHELTDLARTREAVINLNVAVREWKEQIIFLRKIIAGAADQSYGIQVARLAGLPQEVIGRAREILNNLEKSELNAQGKPALAAGARRRAAAIINQPELNLFGEDSPFDQGSD
jgi:DNA mismatch repair protein MutS